ncbi:DUF3298 and DUF4163 domain-containing protein [Novosphingobium colocasiae]|uniref:DUF3298 and DUF4163 domain-containing protein n=1 Tax=Novosphingobium colocasiae TaxID=1256513 RepID=UPI0035AED507
MRNGGWILAVALMAASCGGGTAPSGGGSTAAATETAAAVPETAAPPAPAAAAVKVAEKSDLLEFSFAYPGAAAAIPALKAQLDKQLAAARSEATDTAREDSKSAKTDGYPFNPHYYDATWQVVTDLPDWLSLSAEIATYTGGAHGMAVPDTLLWDKSAGAARQPLDLFTSKEALRSATQAAFCAALDKERAKRPGAPVDRASGEMFTECIDPVAQTVILGSSNRRTFDRIGFLIAPYEAGPYAEGSYEVTLPVSDKVMAALKPQYRGAFSVLR